MQGVHMQMLVVALQGASRLSQCAAEDTAAAFQAQGVMPKCCQNVAAAAAAPPTGDTIQLDGVQPQELCRITWQNENNDRHVQVSVNCSASNMMHVGARKASEAVQVKRSC
jgi:hypothetical protein